MTSDMISHISRHFIALQASHVAWLPSPPPGPADEEGITTHHKLFALAAWSEDVQEEHLSFMALVVRAGPAKAGVVDVSTQRLASWRHPGRATALHVADLGSSDAAVFTGSESGVVCRLRLNIPMSPGATLQDVQLRPGGFDGAELRPWAALHAGPVTALAIHPDTVQLLTAGADGRLFLLPALDDLSAGAPRPFTDLGRAASFRAAAWSSPQTFVTASTSGGLEVWDSRSGRQPAARSPHAWTSHQGRIASVAVHPAQPHLAATGSEDGAVAVWDLRFGAPPRVCPSLDAAAGAVRQVAFDVGSAMDGGTTEEPRVLFCTQGGILGAASPATSSASSQDGDTPAATGGGVRVLHQEECATVLSFDVERSGGVGDVLATTDQECLLYLHR